MLLPTASISPLIISNHLHSSNCRAYGLYHLLSRLLLLFIIYVESTVTIYCLYCAIYVDFYCQTQREELFTCDKVCAYVSWVFTLLSFKISSFTEYWVWGSLKPYLLLLLISKSPFLLPEFEDNSKSSFILAEIDDFSKPLLLSLRISKIFTSIEFWGSQNLHFYQV